MDNKEIKEAEIPNTEDNFSEQAPIIEDNVEQTEPSGDGTVKKVENISSLPGFLFTLFLGATCIYLLILLMQ